MTMVNSLKQKIIFVSFEFSIDDTGLLIRKKNSESEVDVHYSFEQISVNKASVLDHNKPLLIWGSLLGVFVMLSLFVFAPSNTPSPNFIIFCTILSSVFFGIYFFTRHKKIYLYTTDNKPIEFYAEKPNSEDANGFIESLLTLRNEYLLSKYGNPNRNLEYAPQLDGLNWLLNTKAISKIMYDEKVKELNLLFNTSSNNPIGFSTKN